MVRTRTMLAAVPPIVLVALLGAGCGGGETGDDQGGEAPEAVAERDPVPADGPGERQESRMDIRITIGDQTFGATLRDSPATRGLVAQLPVTLEMVDHGGVEKTGPLPGPLSLEGQPEGADPDVADVGYYAPGNDLVLYYGDQSYFPGIVVLGRMDGDAAERIEDMERSVTATIELR